MKKMHQQTVYLLLLLIALLGGAALYLKHQAPAKTFTIALITKDTPCHNKINQGFTETLLQKSERPYAIRFFITNDQNKSLTTALAEEALQLCPDAIVSVGALTSQVAHSVAQRRQSKTPHIFIVGEPENLGLPSRSTHTTTGVSTGSANYIKAAEYLCKIKQNLASVLIPYAPHASGGVIEQGAHNIARFLKQHNVKTTLLPLHSTSETLTKIRHAITNHDTIMILEGCIINDVVVGLIKLCHEKKICLFASEADFIEKGAAAGYGLNSEDIGRAAAHQVKAILEQKVPVIEESILKLNEASCFGRQAYISRSHAQKQNLLVKSPLPKDVVLLD